MIITFLIERKDGEQSPDLFEFKNEFEVDDDEASYSDENASRWWWRSSEKKEAVDLSQEDLTSTLAIFKIKTIKDKDLKFLLNKDEVFVYLENFSLYFFCVCEIFYWI